MHTIAVHREPRDFVRELLLCHSPANTSPESDLLIHFSLGDPLSAHCIVLAAASPFMASTLLTMEHQEEPISLLLPDFSRDEVADFLTSLYQGLSLLPFTELTSTLGVANQRRENAAHLLSKAADDGIACRDDGTQLGGPPWGCQNIKEVPEENLRSLRFLDVEMTN